MNKNDEITNDKGEVWCMSAENVKERWGVDICACLVRVGKKRGSN